MKKQNYTSRTRDFRDILYKDRSEEVDDHRNDPKEWNNRSSEKNYQKLKEKLRKQLIDKLNV